MYSLYVHVMAPVYPQKQYAASAEHSFLLEQFYGYSKMKYL